jgi:hypothetical protein
VQVSYSEGLANHTGPESCVGVREDAGTFDIQESRALILNRQAHRHASLRQRDGDNPGNGTPPEGDRPDR